MIEEEVSGGIRDGASTHPSSPPFQSHHSLTDSLNVSILLLLLLLLLLFFFFRQDFAILLEGGGGRREVAACL